MILLDINHITLYTYSILSFLSTLFIFIFFPLINKPAFSYTHQYRQRIMHGMSELKVTFTCRGNQQDFKKGENLINHSKSCGGAVASRPGYKKCSWCQKVSNQNFATT